MIKAGTVVECINPLDKRLHLSKGMTYRVRLVVGGMVAVEDSLGAINALFQASRFKVADDQIWSAVA